ncbi:hypothetical protein L873DRAFT_631425 [Choiromyces venosus 120613-1]|uniref:Uncharacterized protein n=1 Tax=Choiromyces venosus 120613-1 TaxID=1336337 RepID=A0A3N4JTP1_9PEZI|nr:hypothetical protein L873DRAFT_631425 [Choiromyces venosus 120613-1]
MAIFGAKWPLHQDFCLGTVSSKQDLNPSTQCGLTFFFFHFHTTKGHTYRNGLTSSLRMMLSSLHRFPFMGQTVGFCTMAGNFPDITCRVPMCIPCAGPPQTFARLYFSNPPPSHYKELWNSPSLDPSPQVNPSASLLLIENGFTNVYDY